MEAVKQKAEAFSKSYTDAMTVSLQPGSSRSAVAEALAAHYKPGFVYFALGNSGRIEEAPGGGTTTARESIEGHLKNFEKAGLGWKIRGVSQQVMPLSPFSAQCWLTWEIVEPDNGVKGWQWTNIYGFRLAGEGDEKGCWEYSVADGEMLGIISNCPRFFERE